MSEFSAPDYLGHIRRAAVEASSFVDRMDKAAFMADLRTQKAVVMNLLIVGEAATRLMDRHPNFAAQHPGVPWHSMRGMRNRLAHGYFDINLDVVWDTVQTALPELLNQLPAIDLGTGAG